MGLIHRSGKLVWLGLDQAKAITIYNTIGKGLTADGMLPMQSTAVVGSSERHLLHMHASCCSMERADVGPSSPNPNP
jgi:hypothetical protein